MDLIRFFFSSALLLAATGWLVRSLIRHFLTKDVETFKTQIATAAAKDVAELTHRLQLVAVEHEKRTHLLQEKRAAAIERLYGRLVTFWVPHIGFPPLSSSVNRHP